VQTFALRSRARLLMPRQSPHHTINALDEDHMPNCLPVTPVGFLPRAKRAVCSFIAERAHYAGCLAKPVTDNCNCISMLSPEWSASRERCFVVYRVVPSTSDCIREHGCATPAPGT
jgi:hypothetical protein